MHEINGRTGERVININNLKLEQMKLEIKIGHSAYIIDFKEKQLLDLSHQPVKGARNLLSEYITQEKIAEPKNTNNHTYIGLIKKHMNIKTTAKKNIKSTIKKEYLIKNKLFKKLKTDYNNRNRKSLNEFESFEIFHDWYNLLEKKCFYCGISEEQFRFIVMNGILKSKRFPENGEFKRGSRGYYLELDKKDSSLKYSIDNCVLSCYFCNNDKSDVFNSEEYLNFSKNRLQFLENLSADYNNQ